ncbi:MAG: OmpA family protein [Bacteroidales bacterium]|nr:OmpA family protein [Bacteroidales bacterium]
MTIGFFSCGVKKGHTRKHKKHPKQEIAVQQPQTKQDSLEIRRQYNLWRKNRIVELDSVIVRSFGEDLLYARTDTSFSVYINASQLFKPNSSTPMAASYPYMQAALRLLCEQSDLIIFIAGHAADDRNEDYNLHLSAKRARNLVKILREEQLYDGQSDTLSGDRLYSEGYGSYYLNKFRQSSRDSLESQMEFRFLPVR